MEEFIKQLGIKLDGEIDSSGAYVIDIPNSDEFSKIYSILDNSDIVDEVDASSLLSIFSISVSYISDTYQITLTADYDNDIYKLICVELGETK